MAACTLNHSQDCFVLNLTVINIVRAFGYDGDMPPCSSIKIPRGQRSKAHKCDICIPVIGCGLPWADVPLKQISNEFKTSRISVDLQKLQSELPHMSESWFLPLKSCCYSHHSFCVYLDRERSLCNVLPYIVSKGIDYGQVSTNGKQVCISRDSSPEDEEDMTLVQFRMKLAFQSLTNIFERAGYAVTANNRDLQPMDCNTVSIHISNRSTCKNQPLNSHLILCGTVHIFESGIKKTDITAKYFFIKKEEKLRQVQKSKDVEEANNEQIKSLSRAEATAELLFVKLHDNVSIVLDESSRLGSDNRGVSFLLYNHVRLLAIRRKFEELASTQVYPNLPPIHTVNFNLLNQEEEWDIFNFLLRLPSILFSCINNATEGKASLHPILIDLDKICRIFSAYYRRVRVLTEPRAHLLPVMFARLYLLQSLENVINSSLSIFGINTLDHM